MSDGTQATLAKLLRIAGGDFELVNRAIRECQSLKRWRWWHLRKSYAADIGDIVAYIRAQPTPYAEHHSYCLDPP